MRNHLRANLWLLVLTVVLCTVLYPLVLWAVGQTLFPHQAEGSLIDENGNPVTDPAKARGSRLIGQPFKGDEYFQPRPSNAGNGYDATQSGASNWGASNPLLRSRVARQLGPIVQFAGDSPTLPGKPVGPVVEAWFQKQKPDFVAHWAEDNSGVAEQWVKDNADAAAGWLGAHADGWAKKTADDVKANSGDAAKAFWAGYVKAYPGTWPTVEDQTVKGEAGKDKTVKAVKPARDGADVQAFFFDPWLQANRDALRDKKIVLDPVPADMVMASGSGLDPDITLKNARWQLANRVAAKRAEKILDALDPAVGRLQEAAQKETNEARRKKIEADIDAARARARRPVEKKIGKPLEQRVTEVIEELLNAKKHSPLGGLAGVDLVNVLEVNLALDARMKELVREYQ